MFDTEGFVDRHTYFSKEHIIKIVLNRHGDSCLIWYISKLKMDKAQLEKTRERLKDWVERRLPRALDEGITAIQREINRFGASFAAVDKPILVICFQERIYAQGEENGTYKSFQKPRGIYASPEAAKLLHETGGNAEKLLNTAEFTSPAEAGHYIMKTILNGLSKGDLKQGYFLLWEEDENV